MGFPGCRKDKVRDTANSQTSIGRRKGLNKGWREGT